MRDERKVREKTEAEVSSDREREFRLFSWWQRLNGERIGYAVVGGVIVFVLAFFTRIYMTTETDKQLCEGLYDYVLAGGRPPGVKGSAAYTYYTQIAPQELPSAQERHDDLLEVLDCDDLPSSIP